MKKKRDFAVRKVKMGLEPPTGCAFSTIKSTSKVKLENIQLRLSNVKTIVTSERRSLRRDRITPMVTVNGSLVNKSLAYMIVGTQRFAKEVPELIKISYNAWRSTSSKYEVVQGIYASKCCAPFKFQKHLNLIFFKETSN